MMHDESVYPDAHSFKPDRFLKDGKIDHDVQDPRDMFFGFGKRCAFYSHIS
jgi:cytochrome P450